MKYFRETLTIILNAFLFIFFMHFVLIPIPYLGKIAIDSFFRIDEILQKRKAAKKQAKKQNFGLMYENQKDIKVTVDIQNCSNVQVKFSFFCNGGVFGTDELLDEYSLSPKRLLQILQERNDYTELEN